jgi:transcriptional regulator with XRE-family HTH domain
VTPRDQATEFARAFGQAVREAREKLGISQEELGFESELDRTYISGIERGVRNPTVKTVMRLCRALGARPSSLLKTAEHRTGWRD